MNPLFTSISFGQATKYSLASSGLKASWAGFCRGISYAHGDNTYSPWADDTSGLSLRYKLKYPTLLIKTL